MSAESDLRALVQRPRDTPKRRDGYEFWSAFWIQEHGAAVLTLLDAAQAHLVVCSRLGHDSGLAAACALLTKETTDE